MDSILISFLVGYCDKSMNYLSLFLSVRKPIYNKIFYCKFFLCYMLWMCKLIQPPQQNPSCKKKINKVLRLLKVKMCLIKYIFRQVYKYYLGLFSNACKISVFFPNDLFTYYKPNVNYHSYVLVIFRHKYRRGLYSKTVSLRYIKSIFLQAVSHFQRVPN